MAAGGFGVGAGLGVGAALSCSSGAECDGSRTLSGSAGARLQADSSGRLHSQKISETRLRPLELQIMISTYHGRQSFASELDARWENASLTQS